MKTFALAAACAALTVRSPAAEELLTFKTTDGRAFNGVKLGSKDPAGIRVITPAGVEEIPFGKRPPELPKKFLQVFPNGVLADPHQPARCIPR